MPAPALRAAQLEESFFKCMATNVTSNRNTKKMAPTLTKAITSMKKVTTILMALALRPLSFFFSFLLPALLPGDTSGLFLSPSCHAFFAPAAICSSGVNCLSSTIFGSGTRALYNAPFAISTTSMTMAMQMAPTKARPAMRWDTAAAKAALGSASQSLGVRRRSVRRSPVAERPVTKGWKRSRRPIGCTVSAVSVRKLEIIRLPRKSSV
mmetsp:Transcript_71537/g.232487  ORF Transcript_71537/g.232487 Transcript_71537/m.232487 type:complete len:209 (-) Transcript_71537:769-1395(-)